MKFSPSLVGTVAGVAAVVVITASLFLWSRSNYAIKGKIQVDTGAYVSPARNTDVKLILGSVNSELKNLVSEFEDYRQYRKEKTIKNLLELGKQNLTNSAKKTTAKKKKKDKQPHVVKKSNGKIKINLEALNDEERAEVNALVAKYFQNSNYCKEQATYCPIGSLFYEKGSLFWEGKAEILQENKRMVFDEITTNYITKWVDGGLDGEPIQVVETVVKKNMTLQELKEALGEIVEEKEEEAPLENHENSLLKGYALTTNDLQKAAVDLKKDLLQKYRDLSRKSDDLMIEMIVDQVTTDEDGNYIFKGKSIKPGEFFISSRYDLLSAEGERVEFSWFYPVTISLKRLAFNKSTVVNLDELNQSKSPVENIYIPDSEEIFLDIFGSLKKQAALVNADTNTIVSVEKNAMPEINVINIIATNNPPETPNKNK